MLCPELAHQLAFCIFLRQVPQTHLSVLVHAVEVRQLAVLKHLEKQPEVLLSYPCVQLFLKLPHNEL